MSSSASTQKSRKFPKYIDPNYPKRPLNAYLRFWMQFRPELMAKNENLNLTKTAQIAGKEWYNLGDIQREEYKREADQEWKTFRQQIQNYKANDGRTKWNEFKSSLPAKMYPKSPVAIYIRENYRLVADKADNAEKTNREIMKQLAEDWKVADQDTKQKYKEIWAQEKTNFVAKYGQYLKYANKTSMNW
eukprot:CAMPEP_0197042594 /NCGR_PEP_ID=MMETSP1384-20130603/18938_1 /TAXON_ID=29189 /ORGANISM="Ammonia sp." /LENGTH=188 /DNA_ID=CAMNT_0042473731 /DNA_START=139 /DNA_END=702 /DNA_ORIENTATION=-